MSKATEPDYIVIQMKIGAAYVDMCGAEGGGINQSVSISKKARRDCAKPAAIPENVIKIGVYDWSLSINAVLNLDFIDEYQGALGIRRDYRILYGRYDAEPTNGERTGTIFGYRSGRGVMESFNESVSSGDDNDSTADLSIQGEGKLTWTVGVPA